MFLRKKTYLCSVSRKFHPKIGDDVASVDVNRYDQSIDRTTLQDQARSIFDKTVADLETKINRTKASTNTHVVIDNDEDDIFPGAAKDMGSGKNLSIRII